jgi:predicted nucleic acid-binding protein
MRSSVAADILTGISESAVHFPDPESPGAVLRDPGDDYLIALARAAGVEAIVTGDRDLLEHPGLEPPAITARAACELLGLIKPSESR